ncbi:hypothetical protein D3Z11_06720 [Clostridium perfringens]|nr:hypothetical protein HMPREF9476_00793 [Clostridium perfringens WAL-14572]OUN55195.1 hypothetical protein B5G18_05100 [Clostridium perfringens]OUP47022.1 hypothetical protein B5F20_06820 [Clostridium perfringens]PWX33032.1 hypothetical protein CYK92_08965 [Clostridium perfringens]PWX49763.1 hypothetical protein CYK72_03140 [Clostridium perfringens]
MPKNKFIVIKLDTSEIIIKLSYKYNSIELYITHVVAIFYDVKVLANKQNNKQYALLKTCISL